MQRALGAGGGPAPPATVAAALRGAPPGLPGGQGRSAARHVAARPDPQGRREAAGGTCFRSGRRDTAGRRGASPCGHPAGGSAWRLGRASLRFGSGAHASAAGRLASGRTHAAGRHAALAALPAPGFVSRGLTNTACSLAISVRVYVSHTCVTFRTPACGRLLLWRIS